MKVREPLVVERLDLGRRARQVLVRAADPLPYRHGPIEDLARDPADRRAGRVRVLLRRPDRGSQADDRTDHSRSQQHGNSLHR